MLDWERGALRSLPRAYRQEPDGSFVRRGEWGQITVYHDWAHVKPGEAGLVIVAEGPDGRYAQWTPDTPDQFQADLHEAEKYLGILA